MYTGTMVRETTKSKAADMIRHQLQTNDQWLVRGLMAVYRYQTSDEQRRFQTKHHNNVGFTGTDAHILTSFAKQIEWWEKTPVAERKYQNPLSAKQTIIARKRMVKYAGQLARIVHNQEN